MRAHRIAWLLAGVSVLLAVVDTVLVAASYSPLSGRAIGLHGWPLVNVAAVGSAVLGAVIVGAHPRQPIGWILNFVGLTTSISLAAESYALWVLQYDGQGSSAQAQLAGWVAAILGGPLALACLTVVFLLVPAGSFLSPRWRWVARAALAGFGVQALGLALIGPSGIDRNGDAVDADPALQVLLGSGVIVIALMLLASVASMLVRLRGSTGATRQQIRVVAIGATCVGLSLVALLVGQALNGGRQSWQTSVPLYASYVLLVVCIAVAVLRYRLYEVEVIVSRAVVLAISTALVAAGYVGLVVTLGRLVEDRTGGGFWLSLLATVVVALAFQPLRRWVVRFADRLAYGERAAPYDALADFTRRIGRSPLADELLPTIAAAAGEAVHAERVVVRLEGEAGGELMATWPSATPVTDIEALDGDVVEAIGDAGDRLGSIILTFPPGRDIRPLERQLLSDIAWHAALALRNARLEIELASRVQQLDRRTRELVASRNRIIGALDTERRRLEASIAARVLPGLLRLRTEVPRAATGDADASTERVGEWVDQVTESLESLRELTRGIHPTMLTRSGLGAALTSYAARVQRAGDVRIDPGISAARFSERVETAAYFCCVEVLEHAADTTAPTLGLTLSADGTDLVVTIHGARLDALTRQAIVDRVEACGGAVVDVGLDGVDGVHGVGGESALEVRLPAAVPVGA